MTQMKIASASTCIICGSGLSLAVPPPASTAYNRATDKATSPGRHRSLQATINAADLLGVTHDLGTIEEGKLADIIAIDGDPLQNVKSIEQVVFVMKGGEVVRNDVHPPARDK